jgi:hypothetical protein
MVNFTLICFLLSGQALTPEIDDIFIEILQESPFYFIRFREPEYHL